MRNYNPKRPPIPACGLIEDDPDEFEEEDLLSDAPSFPLEVFPDAIRNIVEAFEEYENFNVDFTAASFLTVFCGSYEQHMVSPFYDRMDRPSDNLYGTCRFTELWQDTTTATGSRTTVKDRQRI